jgi:hypothetical protein
VILQSQKYSKRIATDPRKYQIAERGEFVFDPMSLYYGSIGRQMAIARGLVSPDYVVFAVDDSVDPIFLHHRLRSPEMVALFELNAEGGNKFGKRRRVYWSVFEDLEIELPPLSEQQRLGRMLAVITDLHALGDQAASYMQLVGRVLVDFENPSRNEFVVTRQYTVQGAKRNIRPDLVLFVNGIPLVVIECKSPTLGEGWKAEAIDQLSRYQELEERYRELAPRSSSRPCRCSWRPADTPPTTAPSPRRTASTPSGRASGQAPKKTSRDARTRAVGAGGAVRGDAASREPPRPRAELRGLRERRVHRPHRSRSSRATSSSRP